ncbi:hypothetical protein SO802_016867 [Lithocarpus litseifolius]|uniref:Uncharacterized protein n=1 Tax=Lithocarpus litseifolius TaxID=425828 RepID=A0AAW2CYD9_9ROSI
MKEKLSQFEEMEQRMARMLHQMQHISSQCNQHSTSVDLENLDLEEVDKEMAVNEASHSTAPEDNAPIPSPTSSDEATA